MPSSGASKGRALRSKSGLVRRSSAQKSRPANRRLHSDRRDNEETRTQFSTHQLEADHRGGHPDVPVGPAGKGETIVLAVMEPVKLTPYTKGGPIDAAPCKRVTIFGERLRRREHETLMLFTATKKRHAAAAEFLPGQRGGAQP